MQAEPLHEHNISSPRAKSRRNRTQMVSLPETDGGRIARGRDEPWRRLQRMIVSVVVNPDRLWRSFGRENLSGS
jgi:hypothetical protein